MLIPILLCIVLAVACCVYTSRPSRVMKFGWADVICGLCQVAMALMVTKWFFPNFLSF